SAPASVARSRPASATDRPGPGHPATTASASVPTCTRRLAKEAVQPTAHSTQPSRAARPGAPGRTSASRARTSTGATTASATTSAADVVQPKSVTTGPPTAPPPPVAEALAPTAVHDPGGVGQPSTCCQASGASAYRAAPGS